MRTIVRYSVNGELDNRLGNALRKILEEAGFQRIGTASWEHRNIAIKDFASSMNDFWQTAGNPQAAVGAAPAVSVDHVWVYTDAP